MKEVISKDLQKNARSIGEFFADPNNVRVHEDTDIHALKSSLAKFGQQKPIVALKSGKVIAGNGTLEAAKQLGWKSIAAVTFENEELASAYAIADNRTAELSRWNDSALAAALDSIKSVSDEVFSATGFTEEQLNVLVDKSFLSAVVESSKTEAEIEKSIENQKQIEAGLGPASPSRDRVASVQSFTFTVVLSSDQHTTLVRAIEKTRKDDKNKAVADAITEIASSFLT